MPSSAPEEPDKITSEDLAEAIDKAKSSLYALPIPSETVTNGVLVKRTGPDTYEYELQLGETDD